VVFSPGNDWRWPAMPGRVRDRDVVTSRTALIPLLLVAMLAGCIDRHRVNPGCEWTGDVTFPIDTRNSTDLEHLVADAQLAEELAIRYADMENERRFGYGARGGLVDGGRVRADCIARLVSVIQTNHAVTSKQVHAARAHRDWRFDVTVTALFVPLYWLGATTVSRRLVHRFSEDRTAVRVAATGLAALIVGFLGLQLGQLWSGVWETIRVGNGHISVIRMASWSYHPWGIHLGAEFVGATVALFCLAALFERRIPPIVPTVAAMLVWTVLGVAFVTTFVRHAAGYAFAALVFVAINAAHWSAGRMGIDRHDASSHKGLHRSLWLSER